MLYDIKKLRTIERAIAAWLIAQLHSTDTEPLDYKEPGVRPKLLTDNSYLYKKRSSNSRIRKENKPVRMPRQLVWE